MKRYVTRYTIRQNSANYQTKSLTKYHKDIHEQSSSATTVETDDSIKDWPFGLYGEVIATSKNGKFTKEFTREFVKS